MHEVLDHPLVMHSSVTVFESMSEPGIHVDLT